MSNLTVDFRLHPLDLESNIAIGISLPLMKSNTQFNLTYTTLDQAKANLVNLLLTNKGERVMLPNFGCDIYKMLFENITDSLLIKIEEVIREEVAFWLPYIQIDEVNVTHDIDAHTINFDLLFLTNGNKFNPEKLVFNIILPK